LTTVSPGSVSSQLPRRRALHKVRRGLVRAVPYSVQRVFADRVIAEDLANRMAATTRLTVGDPYNPGTWRT
jgi:hypothetical protein